MWGVFVYIKLVREGYGRHQRVAKSVRPAPLPALRLLPIHISRSIHAQNLTCIDDQYSYERNTFIPSQQGVHMCWLWSYLVVSTPSVFLFTLCVTSPTGNGPSASEKIFSEYFSAYVHIIRHRPGPPPTGTARQSSEECFDLSLLDGVNKLPSLSQRFRHTNDKFYNKTVFLILRHEILYNMSPERYSDGVKEEQIRK